MPAFQRKPTKFFCRGMNLNAPIDAIPENQFAYLLNVRAYEDGRIGSRPGTVLISTFTGGGGTDYLHSQRTVDEFRFIGFNSELFSLPQGGGGAFDTVDSGFSGNPLSMCPASPGDGTFIFLYVYDSVKQQKYSPAILTGGVPDTFPIGIPQVQEAPVTADVSGELNGDYYWRWRQRSQYTGSSSAPGPPTFTAKTMVNGGVSITAPGASNEFVFDLFRFGGTVNQWQLVGTVPAGGGIVDDVPDIDLLSSETLLLGPSQIPYQPWVTQTPSASGTCDTAAATTADGSLVTVTGGVFNPRLILGTPVSIGGVNYTIRRIVSAGSFYLNEDAGVNAGTDWVIVGGLQEGVVLGRVWGPYGTSQTGAVLFACGDDVNKDRLYWTNGNDPESVSIANSLVVADSSEPLQNGCVYNGRAYAWTIERMFQITPDLIVPGNYTAQVLPGNRGLVAAWGFTVGDIIYFLSKDGIYGSDGYSPPHNLSSPQLNTLFPHDGQGGNQVFVPNPENFNSPIVSQPPEPGQTKTWRLNWCDSVLYFDYQEFETGLSATLLHDGRNMKGWAFDHYSHAQAGYGMHWQETGFDNILVGQGRFLSLLTGAGDDGLDVECSIMTGADVLGDYRAPKLIGDAVVGATTQQSDVSARILGDNNSSQMNAVTLPQNGAYVQTIIDIGIGAGELNRTVGLWLHWSSASQVWVNDWEPSWVPKPEVTQLRATDWTDDGKPGSKFLKGVIIEANVSIAGTGTDLVIGSNNLEVSSASLARVAGNGFLSIDVGSTLQITFGSTDFNRGTFVIVSVAGGVATLDHPAGTAGAGGGSFILSGSRQVEIQFDGGSTAMVITLSGGGQTEQPYSIVPPRVVKEMRVLPFDLSTCEIFKAVWLWDPYPEFLNINEDYYLDKWPSGKYVRGVAVEGDSQGTAVQLAVLYDGGSTPGNLNINQDGKTLSTFAFGVPFLANEIKLIPLGSWRRFSVRWIFDEYPDFAALITAWADCGTPRAKYLRGGILRLDTAGLTLTPALKYDGGATAVITPTTFIATGQNELAFALAPPAVVHLVRWEPNIAWRYWATEWDFDVYPELIPEYTSIIEVGGPGAKFMQGIRLTADTNNLAVSFQVLYDGGQIGASLAGTFNGKMTLPFSFPTPFVAHNLQIRPLGDMRIFIGETEWVWEPSPDFAMNWQTQPTDHDLPDFHALRDCWIAYQSHPNAVLAEQLIITTQYGTKTYTLPVSATYARIYLPLAPQKASWRSYQVTSTLGVRLFVRDIVVRVKNWGDPGPFRRPAPFGDYSRQVGARI